MSAPFLRQGDEGPSVSALQLALAALGYDVGQVDGIFGEATARALQAFQENQGLGASGEANDDTWSALGGQPFSESDRTQINASEFPAIARVLYFADDIDGYLQDLGIDSTSISDDDEPSA